MAERDRQRLLERALALPLASEADFFAGRRPPPGADPHDLRVIADTGLRTKLVEVGLAEGLQSPKGPQKIASIVRIYPNYDAPPRVGGNGRPATSRPSNNGPARRKAEPSVARGLPSLEEMEALIVRIRRIEAEVAHELSAQLDDRIERLKRSIGDQNGEALDAMYEELGEALGRRRELSTQIRSEAFARVAADESFAARTYLRLLAR
jgi:hypothetical protein